MQGTGSCSSHTSRHAAVYVQRSAVVASKHRLGRDAAAAAAAAAGTRELVTVAQLQAGISKQLHRTNLRVHDIPGSEASHKPSFIKCN
jgi:hypothetical protein